MKRIKATIALVRRAPDQLRLAGLAAWRGKERGLAVFAGVFLASLVMATVIGYGAGLSQIFLQEGLKNEVFDAKIDFDEKPNENNTGRTNDSSLWSSICDDLAAKINRFVKDDGTVITTGQTSFRDGNGERREIPVLDCLGIKWVTRFRKDTRSTFH